MSSWGFDTEGTQVAAGANTVAGLKAGYQPYEKADVLSSKRNVIATNKGWIRRTIKTNESGPVRIIDEPLVPANPGTADGYANTAYLGFADIAQMYMDSTSVSPGATSVYVVFNEPLKHEGDAGDLILHLANTASGNAEKRLVATADNSNTGIVNANNTLKFNVTFLVGDAGTYKVQAASNTIINATATAANLVSLNTYVSANLTVTGAVSNTLGTITVSAS